MLLFKRLASQLQPPDDTHLVGNDTSICTLAKECENISQEVLDLLDKILPKDKSKLESLRAEKDLKKLEEKLLRYQNQLKMVLDYING